MCLPRMRFALLNTAILLLLELAIVQTLYHLAV